MFFSKQIFMNVIETELQQVVDSVSDIIISKWIEGGHSLTGAFENELRKDVQQIGNKVVANIWLNDYYRWVNDGVAAEDIPFSPGSGADHSAYIQGLITYFQLRAGLSLKDATGAAFATAHKHLAGGMPTDKSRLGFFTAAMADSEGIITQGISEIFGDAMKAVISLYQSQLHGQIRIIL